MRHMPWKSYLSWERILLAILAAIASLAWLNTDALYHPARSLVLMLTSFSLIISVLYGPISDWCDLHDDPSLHDGDRDDDGDMR